MDFILLVIKLCRTFIMNNHTGERREMKEAMAYGFTISQNHKMTEVGKAL